MGNQHSAAHATLKPRKNVHWKSAGRPAVPGKPDIIPVEADDEPNAITLRWEAGAHDGGAPLQGYQVECNRLGSAEWVRTSPPLVARPELVLSGLAAPHRYRFRVAAVNAVGRSDFSELSDVLTVAADRAPRAARAACAAPPAFLAHLRDATALENDQTEFRVTFTGAPPPTVAWFKDDYEIFSSRRTAITTADSSSVLLFHQTLASDEGEIKCTATNRAGHAVSRARLVIEAAPKLRYPRQYEDGLLYEVGETVFLKTTIVGRPTPRVEWRHDGRPIVPDERVEVFSSDAKASLLKIHAARRSDRGEYQVQARNSIGEDSAAFLVTVTAPPEPPRRLTVTGQVDRSVRLSWEAPLDDGGCRVGNYVVEYFRAGWNVWLKAATSRQTSATLGDLIEGSEYRFRVKAESPYGMSAPSAESAAVRIPGRGVDVEFLAVEARIISDELARVEGDADPPRRVSPAPRRKRSPAARPASLAPPAPHTDRGSNEFMLVLYPDKETERDKAEKRKSFQLELEEALSPPPLSLSAPELWSARAPPAFRPLRAAASSTELLHERAMARFYRAVELDQQRQRARARALSPSPAPAPAPAPAPRQCEPRARRASHDSEASDRWATSFDEDYTASTVSTDGDYSAPDDDELDTYRPPAPDRSAHPSPPRDGDSPPLEPIPTVDPSFVPKPILKRREAVVPELESPRNDGAVELGVGERPELDAKPKKEEKINSFKKFTEMPVQKPFPKILKKAEPKKAEEKETEIEAPTTMKTNDKKEKEDETGDEGRTVIDYYGNIVKEYGGQKKPSTRLYLNTDDLKTVAEKQRREKALEPGVGKKRRRTGKIKTATDRAPPAKSENVDSVAGERPREPAGADPAEGRKVVANGEKVAAAVVLRGAQRATVVIPIDYGRLEARARRAVRSALACAVDACLLLVAFWVYLFRDERLALPLLALALYRRPSASLPAAPRWLRARTPAFLRRLIGDT